MLFNLLGSFFAALIWVSLTLFVAVHEVVLAFDLLDVSIAFFDHLVPVFVGVLLLADIFIDQAIVGSRNSIFRRRASLGVTILLACIIAYFVAIVLFGADIASKDDNLKRFCGGLALLALFMVRFISYLKVAEAIVPPTPRSES